MHTFGVQLNDHLRISEVYKFQNNNLTNPQDLNSMNASFSDALVSTAVLESVSIALKNPGQKTIIDL